MMMIFLAIVFRNSIFVNQKPDFNIILHFHDANEAEDRAVEQMDGTNEEGEDYSGITDISLPWWLGGMVRV